MSAPQFLPWQLETARNWLGNRERFAHAWLVHGLAGIGKLDFAVAAAASLLCETPQDGLACGHCAACAWFASGNHPDLRRIRPEAIAVEEAPRPPNRPRTPSPWPAAHPSARRPRKSASTRSARWNPGSTPPPTGAAGAWRYCIRPMR